MISDKILLIVLDGGADRPLMIDGREETPLSSAKTENLDILAEEGISGMMDVLSPGIPPGSDTGHLSLLGYDPYKVYTGRGPIEAAGAGIDVKRGDVAFRCNFATLEDGKIIDRRAGRIRETEELAKAIDEEVHLDVDFIFKRSTGHRAALVFRGDGLGGDVTASDPKEDGIQIKESKALKKGSEKTAEILNDFVEQSIGVLSDHPVNEERAKKGLPRANAILTRGAGLLPEIERFEERYGLKGAVVAAAGLVIGISRICGLDFVFTEGATGGTDSNVNKKVENALRSLKNHDFVLMNIKGTDEAGHDRNFAKKSKFFERIDEAFERLLGLEDTMIAITADHTTSVAIGDHTGDPVPICIHGEGVRSDSINKFDEFNCASGGLGRIRGRDLMPILTDLTNRSKKFGA